MDNGTIDMTRNIFLEEVGRSIHLSYRDIGRSYNSQADGLHFEIYPIGGWAEQLSHNMKKNEAQAKDAFILGSH